MFKLVDIKIIQEKKKIQKFIYLYKEFVRIYVFSKFFMCMNIYIYIYNYSLSQTFVQVNVQSFFKFYYFF